jgi:hypothetical protein
VFHYYKKETSWRLSLFSGAPPLPAAKGRLPAGGLIEILQGELAGVSPTGTPSLRNRNILPKIDFDRLFQKNLDAVSGKLTASGLSGVFGPRIFTSQTRDENGGFQTAGGSRTLVTGN